MDLFMVLCYCAGCIERSRELLGQELAALVGESYERAYQNMVRVQQLTELEETIDYSLALTLAQGTSSYVMLLEYPISSARHCLAQNKSLDADTDKRFAATFSVASVQIIYTSG